MQARSRWFYVRLAVLLGALFLVVVYAIHDVLSRRARNAWDHTLAIAIIVVKDGPVDDAAIAALRARVPALEARLEDELHRYRPGAPKPFAFSVLGPVDDAIAPPAVSGEGIIDLASHEWKLHRWTKGIDDRVHLPTARYDSRVYVMARRPRSKHHFVEGSSEQGGRIGVAVVDLDDLIVDFAWAVIAHELFHTLGATDHYDESGRVRVPDGLVEPNAVPLYPQRFVEIMTRGRPTSETEEQTLDTVDELGVGAVTAREVGWIAR